MSWESLTCRDKARFFHGWFILGTIANLTGVIAAAGDVAGASTANPTQLGHNLVRARVAECVSQTVVVTPRSHAPAWGLRGTHRAVVLTRLHAWGCVTPMPCGRRWVLPPPRAASACCATLRTTERTTPWSSRYSEPCRAC